MVMHTFVHQWLIKYVFIVLGIKSPKKCFSKLCSNPEKGFKIKFDVDVVI